MRIYIVKKRTLLVAAGLVIAAVVAALLLLIFVFGDRSGTGLTQTALAPIPEEYELNVLTGRNRELPVYSVARDDQKIALTVDAAWEDDKTDFILKTLDEYKIKATFFLCGVWVETYPDHVKAIAEKGHEIGNHSLTHPHMNALDKEAIRQEIEQLDDRIEDLTGKRTTLFRAPYGEYNNTVVLAVRDTGRQIVQWDVDTIDWKKERSSQTILDTVLPKLKPGCIILCHNNGYQIKEYLPKLIEAAQAQGYEFATVSELLLTGDTTIDPNGVQQSVKPSA